MSDGKRLLRSMIILWQEAQNRNAEQARVLQRKNAWPHTSLHSDLCMATHAEGALPQCLFWCCVCMRCTCFRAAAWLRVINLEAAGAAAEAVRLLLPLGRISIPTAAPVLSAMVSLGRLCTACLSATICWLLKVLLLEVGARLFALLVRSWGKGGLCCLSAWNCGLCASPGCTEAAGPAACSAPAVRQSSAAGVFSRGAAVEVLTCVFMAVAAAAAKAEAVAVLSVGGSLVAAAAAVVVLPDILTSS